MDELDILLTEAWQRISARARRDRLYALKKSQRRFKGVLTRPMREWCLVIRASDTRLNSRHALIEPLPGEILGPDVGTDDLVRCAVPHRLTIDGAHIRRLTAPVRIAFPGVTYQQAADMLGRTKDSLYEWVSKGVFMVNRYPESGYPSDGKRRGRQPRTSHPEHIARIIGRAGDGRPYVWTASPIDPNNFHGRPPHHVWGTLWQTLGEQLPAEYVLSVERVPRYRPQHTRSGDNTKFMGWEFICPGRFDAQGQSKGCGRRCTYLYAPQTVWTLGMALSGEIEAEFGDDAGFDMPEDSGLAGRWYPGISDPIKAAGPRSFACKLCWGVRSAVMSSNKLGWNDFITQISGGLLSGRDVKRPLDLYPRVRRKRPYTWKRRRTREREAAATATATA